MKMKTKTTEVRCRIEPHIKQEAQRILQECGLDISKAIRLMLLKVVEFQGIPFNLSKVPNEITARAIQESRDMQFNKIKDKE